MFKYIDASDEALDICFEHGNLSIAFDPAGEKWTWAMIVEYDQDDPLILHGHFESFHAGVMNALVEKQLEPKE